MNLQVLKALEILINSAYYNEKMTNQIKAEFSSKDEFISNLKILYSELLINTIVAQSNKKPNFSISNLISKGKISLYSNNSVTNTEETIYYGIIEALKNGQYIFDSDGVIHLTVGPLPLRLNNDWLENLANGLKKSTYQKVFLYNKNRENDITDENSLVNYLYHTKTFIIENTITRPIEKIEKNFTDSKRKTEHELSRRKVVKVDDVIDVFSRVSSNDFDITKYKLPSPTYIIKKVNRLGINFYKQPLHIQKKKICDWILEYINCNEINNEVTREFIAKTCNPNKKVTSDFNKQNIIPGLISLYIQLLNNLDINFDTIALHNFKITNYLTPELQEHLLELQSIIKTINKNKPSSEEELINRINSISNELNNISILSNPESLIAKNDELNEAVYQLNYGSITIERLLQERNTLQNIIHYEQENSLTDLAFDNEKIIYLIKKCVTEGRIYLNPLDKNKIIMELYNKELGRITFQTEITIQNALMFITINNELLEQTVPHVA